MELMKKKLLVKTDNKLMFWEKINVIKIIL